MIFLTSPVGISGRKVISIKTIQELQRNSDQESNWDYNFHLKFFKNSDNNCDRASRWLQLILCFFVILLNCSDSHYLFWYTVIFSFVRYWMQQPHVRKSMKLGSRRMSDGLEIYKAMIEDTMQSIRPELVEAMENYKVCETNAISTL
jgi:hypothetical protein